MIKNKKILKRSQNILSYVLASMLLLWLAVISSCNRKDSNADNTLFESLDSSRTGIQFINSLSYTNDFNIYKYRNYYNGGGVGLGDVNNDGLLDIYFTGNLVSNRLYLNKGDFVFEDVTDDAMVGGSKAWSTGVSMVDINADGWMDIYVCNSGDVAGDNKQNEFFINNKDGTFSEMAEEMGVADKGYSTQAAFFDYDLDGDLDIYLLNNSYRSIGSFNLQENDRPIRDVLGGDKLMRNNDGVFEDVSEAAGIYGSVIGFGLGVSVSDLDKDGWPDLYISNDFFERDYIYMNNGDGTFREELEKQMRSISAASMGSDVADINGDGYPEIFVTEMLPEGEERFKTTMTFEDWNKYQYNLKNGYYHQFTRNMLHRHNGIDSLHGPTFSEIGRMSGVEATDWSWSALITDFDQDGYKDLFIANGLAQDILNQDYINYVANEEVARMIIKEDGVDYGQLIGMIPVNRIPNYAYAGQHEMMFKNKTAEWGLAEPSHSNGAAYGDLDNDGDLDLVVNNANMAPFIYRNRSEEISPKNNYLKVALQGVEKNKLGVGAKVTIKNKGKTHFLEQFPNRGFQSSIDPVLNFGLGKDKIIDTLLVEWPTGKQTLLTKVKTGQTLVLKEADSRPGSRFERKSNNYKSRVFEEITESIGINYTHKENRFIDFDRDRLLYHMKSTEGPKMAMADVDGNGTDDFFIGGAKDSPGKLFLQTPDGKFRESNLALFEQDAISEDTDCLFVDVDGDRDQDLYVTSGGSEFSASSLALLDRLYINDGKGIFHKSEQNLPAGKPESTSVVTAADYDQDGDLDLFVGVRMQPGLYGIPQNGYILENDGSGQFMDATKRISPELTDLGLITDAAWEDYDQDGDPDLIVVGEWMSIKLFRNEKGKFTEVSRNFGLENTSGWWNVIRAADIDGDGDVDFVVGNHGLNSRFKASVEEPISCYINDFDKNGSVEQLICSFNDGNSYPMVLRHDLVKQMPELNKKYLKYESYKGQQIHDIFTEEQLKGSVVHHVVMLESVILRNNGRDGFVVEPLPYEAQLAPVYGMLIQDMDHDGQNDIVLGGNLHNVKPEVGRYDASYGLLLTGTDKGKFQVVPFQQSGLFLEGEVRDFQLLKINGSSSLAVSRNNDSIKFFRH